MKVKLRATLPLACLTISCLMGCPRLARADEPVYQNKTLTSWLQDFAYGNYQLYDINRNMAKQRREKQQAAEHAIQAMGKTALPALLDRIVVPFGPPGSDPGRRALYERYEQNYRTEMGFAALGAQARPAIPDLIKLLAPAYDAAHQSLSEPGAQLKESQAITAAAVLRGMGEVVLPPLIEALSSKDRQIRFGAAMTLGDFRDHTSDVVPSLIKALEDEDKDVRWRAARSIGDLQQMPETAVPALAKVVRDDPDVNVRLYAISALEKFGADATAAIPTLGAATNDPDPVVQSESQEALKQIRAAVQKVASP